jgi:hypothetical protein
MMTHRVSIVSLIILASLSLAGFGAASFYALPPEPVLSGQTDQPMKREPRGEGSAAAAGEVRGEEPAAQERRAEAREELLATDSAEA